jgi:predicted nucleic acid-binding protein
MRSTVLVDTRFLIALLNRTDAMHASAKRMLVALVRVRNLPSWPPG